MITLKTISEEVHTIQEMSENLLILINENIKIEIQKFYDYLWIHASSFVSREEWNKLSSDLVNLFPGCINRYYR